MPLAADIVAFTYDEPGRPKTRTVNAVANFDLTYDPAGRVSNQTNPLGSFGATYIGSSGRVNVVTNPNTTTATHGWYPNAQDQRLQTITHARGATTLSKWDYTYDAEGQIATQSMQNDATPPVLNSFGYDTASQLVSHLSTHAGTTTRQIFGYDTAGNRTSVQQDNAVSTETTNNVNQLTARSGGGPLRIRGSLSKPGKVKINGKYAWTAPDNSFEGSVNVSQGLNTLSFLTENYATPVNTASYQYQINVAAATATGSYAYDANGNQTSAPGQTYEWDAENRLIKINYTGSNPVQSTAFAYDGLSRRVRISETVGSSTTVQNFLWAGEEIVEQRDAGNNVTKRYYPQGFTVGGANYFYTKDHLGSVREITDAGGNILTRYNYGIWGVRSAIYLSGSVNTDFGYTGHYEHAVSGLTLTHYRAYNSALGRWLSRDPIGELGPDGPNTYAYVRNAPTMYVDPDGRWAHIAIGAGVGFVGGGVGSWASGNGFWKGAVAGTVAGAVTAATFNPALGAASAAGLSGIGAGVAAGALAGGAGGLASGLVAEGFDAADPCEDWSWGDVGESTLWGIGTGTALGPLNKALGQADDSMLDAFGYELRGRSMIMQGILDGDSAIFIGIGTGGRE